MANQHYVIDVIRDQFWLHLVDWLTSPTISDSTRSVPSWSIRKSRITIDNFTRYCPNRINERGAADSKMLNWNSSYTSSFLHFYSLVHSRGIAIIISIINKQSAIITDSFIRIIFIPLSFFTINVPRAVIMENEWITFELMQEFGEQWENRFQIKKWLAPLNRVIIPIPSRLGGSFK